MNKMDLTKIYIDATTNVKDALGMQFVAWVLRVVDTVGISNSYTIELNYLSNGYPGRTMSDDQKLEILNKIVKAGISLDAYIKNG